MHITQQRNELSKGVARCNFTFNAEEKRQLESKLKRHPNLIGTSLLETSNMILGHHFTINMPDEIYINTLSNTNMQVYEIICNMNYHEIVVEGDVDLVVVLTTETSDRKVEALSCVVRGIIAEDGSLTQK